MKKLFPIAIVAVAAMMFTSCKKDYTCTCKFPSGVLPTVPTTIPKTTKKDAKEKCDALNTAAKTLDAANSCSL